jgi:colanic acid biosynthesis glycosyl transferase WcaI
MRILIHTINFAPEPTSTGKYTGEMAEWLATHGHEIRVVTTPPHYPQWEVFDGYSAWRFSREKQAPDAAPYATLEVFRCPVWIPRMPRGWKRILHLISFSLSSLPTMMGQIRWKPDVVMVVAPTLFCCPHVLSVARLSGAVAWLHLHDFEVDVAFQLEDFSSRRLRQSVGVLERFVLRKFDRISTISGRMIDRLSEKGVDLARTILFPNWVDTSVIYPMSAPSPLRRELGIPPQAVVALYSGNMGKKQGLDLLVETSRKLASRTDIQFVFCGDGSYRETFVQMTRNAGNVIILPLQPAERLNHLLNLADIHLLPQVAGAADLMMPSKLTGMMASGRPTVATASPGTQLFSAIEGRGISTPPGDLDAFADALVHLAGHPYLRTRLGEAARQYAIDHLNRDEILRRFEISLLRACGVSDTQSTPGETSAVEDKSHEVEEVAVTPGAGHTD